IVAALVDWRIRDVRSEDTSALFGLLRDVAVFEPHEIRVAEELIEQAVAGSRDYLVHVAEAMNGADRVIGYVCHGHNSVTDAMYDLYWIAVQPRTQHRGLGRALLTYTEERVRGAMGRGIAIETSGR